MTSKSRKFGKSTIGCQIYEACVAIPCAVCGKDMQPGEHFQRPTLPGQHGRCGPICRACEPFQERKAET